MRQIFECLRCGNEIPITQLPARCQVCESITGIVRPEPGTPEQHKATWQFVSDHQGNNWTWKRIAPDGSIDNISQSFSELGALMDDALRHGFSALACDYEIHTPSEITRYRLGHPPARVLKRLRL